MEFKKAAHCSAKASGSANGGLNLQHQIGDPRSIQLALKLQF
jgi:hypothetical protein